VLPSGHANDLASQLLDSAKKPLHKNIRNGPDAEWGCPDEWLDKDTVNEALGGEERWGFDAVPAPQNEKRVSWLPAVDQIGSSGNDHPDSETDLGPKTTKPLTDSTPSNAVGSDAWSVGDGRFEPSPPKPANLPQQSPRPKAAAAGGHDALDLNKGAMNTKGRCRSCGSAVTHAMPRAYPPVVMCNELFGFRQEVLSDRDVQQVSRARIRPTCTKPAFARLTILRNCTLRLAARPAAKTVLPDRRPPHPFQHIQAASPALGRTT
jgi:hypothetical protein